MMSDPVLATPRELMADHLRVIRQYATRCLVGEEALNAAEDEDRAARMREFFAIGETFKLTGREMVAQLLGDLAKAGRGCECAVCNSPK